MKERPILFSDPMIRAIREGIKTQTRRVRHPREKCDVEGTMWKCRYGDVGDFLWIREAWNLVRYQPGSGIPEGTWPVKLKIPKQLPEGWTVIYRADDLTAEEDQERHWRPSIHLPRWACRLVLQIERVKMERLQMIGDGDAKAEGCHGWYSPVHPDMGSVDGRTPREEFRELWDSINGAKDDCAWAYNPWVWAITFAVVTE